MKQDRIVVITGAAGDMGSVFVARFLANGDTVIATDNRGEELNELPSHTKLSLVVGDISKEEDCEKIAELVCKGAKRVDVLINCAGHFPINPFEQMSADNWRHVIDINLTGNFLMTRAVLPLMKSRGWGRIINVGSVSVFEGVPGQAHYVAAKAGIIGLSRSLAREFGDYGITVNVVTPGLTSRHRFEIIFRPRCSRRRVMRVLSNAMSKRKTLSERSFSLPRRMRTSSRARSSMSMAEAICTELAASRNIRPPTNQLNIER
jgi:NAD(P)-dependent dehydrogenase (short-subunit alcohol dehydrogenase family)